MCKAIHTERQANWYTKNQRMKRLAMKRNVILVGLVFAMLSGGILNNAHAAPMVLIDFEGLGVSEGDNIPTIDGIVFDGAIGVGGDPLFAFYTVGFPEADTAGSTGPFSNIGNVFATQQGGGDFSGGATNYMTATFPNPVADLSFLVVDIEPSENFTAEVFNASDVSLATRTLVGGNAGTGDGVVSPIDFSGVSNIRKLVITGISDFGQDTRIGFGVDDLRFSVAPTSGVPEPASLALVAFGLLSLAMMRRRQC